MAFQPIINLSTGTIFAHEALVRGTAGESAGSLLSKLNADNLYPFDQACRDYRAGMGSHAASTGHGLDQLYAQCSVQA
jgi:hypothetical protein